MTEYKDKYDTRLFAQSLLEEQKEKREATILKKYTPEEIKKWRTQDSDMLSERSKKHWDNMTEEERVKRGKVQSKNLISFHENLKEDKARCSEFNNNKLDKRKRTNLEIYGVEFPQSLKITKEKVKQTKLEKFGDENYNNIKKQKETLKERYGKYSNFFPRFSLVSQELFALIEKEIGETKCFYATNGNINQSNEFQILHEPSGVVRFLDFYVPEKNLCIEFDEKYHKSKKQQSKDRVREKHIKYAVRKIKILRIKQSDYEGNPNLIVKKCIDFILSNNVDTK